MNYQNLKTSFNKEFIVHEYPAGNSSITVEFIKYPQNQRPRQRIALIWDGASYHRSDEVKKFLAAVNDRYERLRSGKLLVFDLHMVHPNKTPQKMFGYRPRTFPERRFDGIILSNPDFL